jgi:hypothetical protein
LSYVTITGIEPVQAMHKKMMDKKNYLSPIDALLMETVAQIKKNAPVRTGILESSVMLGAVGNDRIISVGVPYAEHMEFGTINFPVGTVEAPRARTSTSGKPCYHPFIRPAIWKKMKEASEKGIYFKSLFTR